MATKAKAAKTGAKKAPQGLALCDYCGLGLGSEAGSVRVREYWRLALGLHACDPCLLRVADDFPSLADERTVALRLLHVRGVSIQAIDAVIERARNVVHGKEIARLVEARAGVLELHRAGEFVASMWAGQSLWNMANHLHESMATRKARKAGEKSIQGGRKSADIRARADRNGTSKKALILKAAAEYKGPPAARVAAVTRRTNSTDRYVRKVLNTRN